MLGLSLHQDVDQRITRDVARLCDDLAALIPSAVKPVVDLLWFRYALGCRRAALLLVKPMRFFAGNATQSSADCLCLEQSSFGHGGVFACMAIVDTAFVCHPAPVARAGEPVFYSTDINCPRCAPCSVQLYQLTGRRGMAILYLYAFLGFGALSAVTPDFGALAKKVPCMLRLLGAQAVLWRRQPSDCSVMAPACR